MASFSKLKIENNLYDVKDDTARTTIDNATNFKVTKQIIGTFLGKTHYRLVIQTNTPSSTNVAIVYTLSNLDIMTNLYGTIFYSNQQVPLTFAYSSSVLNSIFIEGNNINVKVTAGAYTNCPCNIIIEYTENTN